MSDPSFALQSAVLTALGADSALQALIGTPARIFDDPPRGTPFPYVTFGNATVRAWDTATDRGHEHTLLLHAWSRQGGRKEAKAILSAVYDILHESALVLIGHNLVTLRFGFADIFRDADGETLHGIARYRAVTEPI